MAMKTTGAVKTAKSSTKSATRPKAATTKRKTTARRSSAAAKAADATGAQGKVEGTQPSTVPAAGSKTAATPVMRRAQLVDLAAERSGLRKNQIKSVLDAILPVIGEALARGETVNLPGLGKVSVQRMKDKGDAKVVIARIRQNAATGLRDTTATETKTALEAVGE